MVNLGFGEDKGILETRLFLQVVNKALGNIYTLFHVFITLGFLCMSYATAFVLSLAFDSPAVQLEKGFLLREEK